MTTAFDQAAFERATDSFLRFLTPEQAKAITAFRGDQSLQNRIEQLARKSTEGELTEQEEAEYQGYVLANKFIAVIQATARKMLAGS